MDVLVLLAIIALLGVVAWFISLPLRRPVVEQEDERTAMRVADLEAAKQAKYREIRELELDHRTGKVTDADFREQDRRLRAEAVVILRELDELAGDRVAATS